MGKIIITENQFNQLTKKLLSEAVGVPENILDEGRELYEIVKNELKNLTSIEDEENEHYGMWLHGGTGNFLGGRFLYVTDELDEALHYARIKGGNVYKLRDEYNYIVDWAMGQSEGMISQEKLMNSGGFDNVFELFIEQNKKDTIVFNSDDKIKIGYNGVDRNKIFNNDEFIGWFGIRYIGDIKLSDVVNFILTTDVDNDKIFKNSIVFEGGFEIKDKFQKQGFGKKVISKIFNDNPNINNILLYAFEEQNAVGYWIKIGGEIIFEEDGVIFFNLKRGNF